MTRNLLVIVVLLILGLTGCASEAPSTAPVTLTTPTSVLAVSPVTTATTATVPNTTTTSSPPSPTTAPQAMTTATTPPQSPADLKVMSVSMYPIVVEPGKPATVEVKVINAGGTAGSTKITLSVNGVGTETKEITVPPRDYQTVAFKVVENKSGVYEIKVAGFSDTLRVKQAGAYPRIGNNHPNFAFFYGTIDPARIKLLAQWDIIAVAYSAYVSAPEAIREIRKLNPQIKILAWFEFGAADLWELKAVLASNESWYLHYGGSAPAEQRRVKLFTLLNGAAWHAMNPSTGWAEYVANYMKDKIMSSGLFDGIYYDCIWERASYRGNIDINNDGVADSADVVDREYLNGMTKVLRLTRELLGPNAMIIGNPGAEWSANSPFWSYANGLYQENALGTESWSSHDFSKVWEIYLRNMQKPSPPSRINWIGVDVNNSKEYPEFNPVFPAAELQKARYGLAIALLNDGYFGFDRGDDYHNQVWWLPEYDANLGLAKGKAQQRSDGTWTREFDNGIVLVNPTTASSTINFAVTYQDVTTGNKGKSFTVQPKDGRIFTLVR